MSSRLNIVVFTTSYAPFIGGAEIAIKEITTRLRERYNFFIITARFSRALPKREVLKEGIIIRVGFGNNLDKILFPILGCIKFFQLVSYLACPPKPRHRRGFRISSLRKPQGFLLWGMDISQGSFAASLIKFIFPRIPFIFTIQYGYGEGRLALGRLGAISLIFKWILARADYVTAISNYLLLIAREYGYLGAASLIPNGVDIEKFEDKSSGTKDSNIIITTSRLVQKNGVDTLLKAVAEVKKNISDVECYIIGDGPKRPEYELLAKNLGLKDCVKFFGYKSYEDLPQYLHQAKIFVRPSRSEGMGNSFVEALAAGIPIIGTPVGGITDIIEDGQTGLLAKVDDPKDLAQKISTLFRSEKLRKEIAAKGKEKIRHNFSWNKIANDLETAFLSIVNARKRVLVATGLFPPEVGGPATYSQFLLEELPRQGILVGVLPFRSVKHFPKPMRHLVYLIKLISRGRGNDFIFAQDPVSVGFPASIAALILRKKFLLKIVGDYAWEQGVQRFGVKELLDEYLLNNYGWRVALLRHVQKWSANRADIIIVPSFYLKSMVEKWDTSNRNIKVINNSFDIHSHVLNKEKTRDKLGLGGTVIITIGRLVPWKGQKMLIQVADELREKIPDLLLIVIGSGPEENKLKQLVTSLKAWSFVRFLGDLPREKVSEYLGAGDIFLLNTAYEGLSHAILEAMASGVPVITTRAGGNTEIIESGREGILVSYNEKEELKQAVLEVYKNPLTRSRLIENAFLKLRQFKKEGLVLELVSVINNL